eukprot:scaffold5715_cov166-Amphora_coffeaeformis.AAC.4
MSKEDENDTAHCLIDCSRHILFRFQGLRRHRYEGTRPWRVSTSAAGLTVALDQATGTWSVKQGPDEIDYVVEALKNIGRQQGAIPWATTPCPTSVLPFSQQQSRTLATLPKISWRPLALFLRYHAINDGKLVLRPFGVTLAELESMGFSREA